MSGRRNTFLTAVLAAALIAGAATYDALRPAEAVRAEGVASSTGAGVLACPFVGDNNVRGYVHVGNVAPEGSGAADVRVTMVSAGAPRVTELRLGPGAQRTIRVTGTKGRSAAIIEYSGGSIVASHSLWTRAHPASGASCAHPTIGDVVVPHLRTLDTNSTLTIFNPGSADADVSIALLADERELRPERLTRRVVRARSRRDFSLGDFAFDTRSLTAVVHTDAGAIVAEGLVAHASGIYAVEGVEPAASVTPISAVSGAGAVSVVNVGEDPIELSARLAYASGQGSAPGVPVALAERRAVSVTTPARDGGGAAAYLLSTIQRPGVVAATSWARGRASRDSAGVTGAPAARRLGAVAAPLLARASTQLVLANPGEEPATVRVTSVVRGRERKVTDVVIEGGRTLAVALPAGPITVEVTSSRPVAGMVEVVARPEAKARPQGLAVLAIACMPLDEPPPIGVELDPRTGVPAPR